MIVIDSFDSALYEFEVFFRKRLVKSHKTAVFAFGVFDIGSSAVKPFFYWILDRR